MLNIWRQFERLLPSSPLLIGTVVADHGDGTLTVEFLDGGLLRVTGQAAINSRVFVRGGEVVSAAPELTVVDIEI